MIKLPEAKETKFVYHGGNGAFDCGYESGWNTCLAEVQRLNATAQPVSDGWVKCSERMPDSNEVLCLVFCRDGETRTGFTSHGDWAMNGKYYDASFVTHWMPLPSAPGGQD